MDDGAAAAAWWCRRAVEAVAGARTELLAAAAVEWAGPAARRFGDAASGLLDALARVAAEIERVHDAARRAAAAGPAADAGGAPGSVGP
jgi:hypothetical protein